MTEDDARKLAFLASQQPGQASGLLIGVAITTLLAYDAVAQQHGYELKLVPLDGEP